MGPSAYAKQQAEEAAMLAPVLAPMTDPQGVK
jgi:hypothetical protein